MNDNIPTFRIAADKFFGRPLVEIFAECGLCSSRNDARRIARQNGLRIFDVRIKDDSVMESSPLREFLFWRGKKTVRRIVVE